VLVTLALVALLGAVFLKGFKEAIGIAVALVSVYLVLNAIVVGVGVAHLLGQPELVVDWQRGLVGQHGDAARMLLVSLLLFPKLALGLSGFETGVAVMPLVQGDAADTEAAPHGRVRNTGKLLLSAALIMSAFLVASSFVTVALIPPAEFEPGGKANGRALAYLAHGFLGEGFGSIYDASTILILWFAGASAMAGLLNIVPRYLPRYGMAPAWARAARPLVLVFTAVAFAVTLIFRADVDAQGGAYATGVLVLMTSAAVAVTLAVRRSRRSVPTIAFAIIALVFAYTTVVNVLERPDGVKIASFFIAAIVLLSIISRAGRATELRVTGVDLDPTALRFIDEAARQGEIRVIAHDTEPRDLREYADKAQEQRLCNGLPDQEPVLFLEVAVCDPSEFAPRLQVRGEEVAGYRVLRAESATVPNAIAAFLLLLRDRTGRVPHAYFTWTEGNPLKNMLRYLLFGEGDIAPIAHEVLREAEPNAWRRPVIHVA
jgi:hypothetical protein